MYSERSGWESVSTAIGDYRRLPLLDGSQLELNTATEVRYRFSERAREMVVVAGEARFRVAHDAAWPFVVRAGDTVVRAVGTEFTVRLYEDGNADVLVSKGVVAVTHLSHRSAIAEILRPTVLPVDGGTAVVAGTFATDNRGRLAIAQISSKKIEAHDAWRTDMLVFDEMPLAKVVAEFNRYNRRKLEIADAAIENVPLTGRFKPRDVDGFLTQLSVLMKTRVWEKRNAFGDVVALRIHATDATNETAGAPKQGQ